MVHQYGIYQGQTGNTSLSGLPSQDAVFVALGFQPGEQIDRMAMESYTNEREANIRQISTEVNNLLQDGLNRPDRFQENAQAAQMLIQLVPIDMQRDVRRHIHMARDPSTYARLLRMREQSQVRDQVDQITQEDANGPTN
jgi:hypothetical protein